MSTWRCRMSFLMFGAYCGDRVDHGVAEGLALLVPRALRAACRARTARSRRGCACRAAPPTGSVSEGITMSMYGLLARSRRTSRRRRRAPCTRRWARSRWRRAGAAPAPGQAREVRQRRRGRGSPCPTSRAACSAGRRSRNSVVAASPGSHQLQERAVGVDARDTTGRRRSRRRPRAPRPSARPSFTLMRSIGGLGADLDPGFLRRRPRWPC